MEMTTFRPTRFGDWVVKLSYMKENNFFLLLLWHVETKELMIKTFKAEMEVIDYVSTLHLLKGEDEQH